MRVEAEAAERARAARDDVAAAEAVRRGEAFVGRLTAIEAGAVPNGYREMIRLATLFGVGEGTRVAGHSDPSVWGEAVAAADARPMVYESAYARFRHGEALLAARGSRDEAAAVLAHGRATADQLGALPLVEAIDGLAARARLPLGEGVEDGPAVAHAPDPVAAYELTARELEVLRLVVAGRTNRQIGEELFISESTAGVHVSRILAKFGVAGRVEAATIAARLGLAD